jgi:hypothetical protein
VLAEAPSSAFVARLQELGVSPLSVGRTIVATWEPNETAVLQVIRELGLELHIIFNKGAVMVLPGGPAQKGHRVIPLPFPATNVRLSLAFDDFGGLVNHAVAHIRIVDTTGTVTRTFTPFNVPTGRSPVIGIFPGEVAASVATDPIAGPLFQP